MSTIHPHDVTLYGGCGSTLILRPLRDEHLPLLYKRNADPEVWYGSDTGNAECGCVSQDALCFLMEDDGVPIGDCWLQRMNIPEVVDKFPGLDVRRIEMTIGEPSRWGQGIGGTALGMLVNYAFCGEQVDLLYCCVADYNVRSQRMLLRRGFLPCGEEALGDGSLRARKECHYSLSRRAYVDRDRATVPADGRFSLPLAELQPSQLYISEGKLRLVREWFDADGDFDPIPIKRLDGRSVMMDGHTRAVAALRAGWRDVPAYWDEDDLDMQAYAQCVAWCLAEGIENPAALAARIVPHADYERLWIKRCMAL